MNYEEFKQTVVDRFLSFMPKEYQDYKVQIKEVVRVNQTLDGLHLMLGNNTPLEATPTLYINYLFEDYKTSLCFKEVMERVAERFVEKMNELPVLPELNLNTIKDSIVFQLINTQQNKEMLQKVPNRPFQDLSIIYRWIFKIEEENVQSTVIQHSLAESVGLSEEQLFKYAVENTRRIFPPIVKNVNELIRELAMKDGVPEEIIEMMIGEVSAEQTMWVIGNERAIDGAVSMLYEDKLHNLAENLKTNLYILPSSIHEVIAVSASVGNPNDLVEMVKSINIEEVDISERLSNQVYFYDKDLRKVSMATKTIHNISN